MFKTHPCILPVLAALQIWSCTTPKRLVTAPVKTTEVTPTTPVTDSFFARLFQNQPAWFDAVLKQSDKYRIQIIYTRIDRQQDGRPLFKTHYYRQRPEEYFYPASTVKLPIAVLALEKLQRLGLSGLSRNSTMITQTSDPSQTAVYNDPSAADGRPSIAHYIKKIFLVSDNDASNRLYEWIGQEPLNKRLHALGFDSVQLLHRLSLAMNEAQNRHTNPVIFYDSSGRVIYKQPAAISQLKFQHRQTKLGQGYMEAGRLVAEPFDFSGRNRFPLADLHQVVTRVMFPDAVPPQQRFYLSASDYRFLYRYMGMMPRESKDPVYDSVHYPDGYVKFLLFGGEGAITDPALRIFNKVGDAYGFLTDAAYVVHFDEGVEFLLSATIYCNEDGIFNDDKYEYTTIGFPFLKKLGALVYEYERKRPRAVKPDFTLLKAAIADDE